MIDTVAASVKLDHDLDVTVFQGVAAREDFASGEQSVRLFRNQAGSQYEPRLTYWPATRLLRVEFSVRKVAASVPFDTVDTWLRGLFVQELPPLTTWTCQRIDYAVDLDVGDLLPQYLALLGRCQVGSWSRQPHASGVVWKSSSRWVKFYDKGRESEKQIGVLRFEVSNYRDAVRYMAHHWFGCERTVGEMVQPGRALYVLARYFEQLGLAAESYDSREYELQQLKSVFGSRSLPGAAHALACIRTHGTESYKSQSLMSKSSYYRWLRVLREHGFLATNELKSLPVLRLPCTEAFKSLSGAQNLKLRKDAYQLGGVELSQKISWEKLAGLLQVSAKTPRNSYLLERFNEWRSNLDGKTPGMQGGGSESVVRAADSSTVVGVGA